jgi:hypothetical protein
MSDEANARILFNKGMEAFHRHSYEEVEMINIGFKIL